MSSITNHQINTISKTPQHVQPLEEAPTQSFEDFALPNSLVSALKDMKISCPTPVQAATLPLAIEGQDIMASAQTGTGKTLAFTIPLMTRLLSSPNSNALVLAPTRELAGQVRDIVRQLLGRQSKINIALLIGGDSMGKQIGQLHARPRIIIGTPGRINDHLDRGSLNLSRTDFIVVDEADRMLDMGFSVQLDEIVKYLPQQRQTLMFSATVPSNILKLAAKYLKDPVRVCVDSPSQAAPKIKQDVIQTTREQKFPTLIRELNEREGSVIIFVKTKRGADILANKLRRENLSADSIHGDLKQRQRDRAILQFRNNKTRIMVATDVAARGIDIPHIRHVINYDLPQEPENYIHRIGRTARAGLEGNSLAFLCPDDHTQWKIINRLMNPGAPQEPSQGRKGRGRPERSFNNRFSKKPQGKSFGNRDRSDFAKRKRPTEGEFEQPSQRRSDKPFGKFKPKATSQFQEKETSNVRQKLSFFKKKEGSSDNTWRSSSNKPSSFKKREGSSDNAWRSSPNKSSSFKKREGSSDNAWRSSPNKPSGFKPKGFKKPSRPKFARAS
jgi:superfamily II DNA/RNA helicase